MANTAPTPISSSAQESVPEDSGENEKNAFFTWLDSNRRTVVLLAILFVVVDLAAAIFFYQKNNTPELALSQAGSREKTSFLSQIFDRSNQALSTENKENKTNQETLPTKTKPPKPIGTGPQEFKFSHGNKVTGPKLQTVSLDPIDPQPNQTITITATIKHDSPVTTANLIIESDNDTTIQPLKLINGDTQTGTWQAELKLKDTYDYNYYIKFDLQSSSGNYSGGLRLR